MKTIYERNYLIIIQSKTNESPKCIYVRKKSLNDAYLKSNWEYGLGVTENNTVFIGKKPIMNYVLACITFFHGGAKQVQIKARGKSISRAIDVAEVVRRRFLPDVKVVRIVIGTDQLKPQDEGSQLTNVSTIEITLQR